MLGRKKACNERPKAGFGLQEAKPGSEKTLSSQICLACLNYIPVLPPTQTIITLKEIIIPCLDVAFNDILSSPALQLNTVCAVHSPAKGERSFWGGEEGNPGVSAAPLFPRGKIICKSD